MLAFLIYVLCCVYVLSGCNSYFGNIGSILIRILVGENICVKDIEYIEYEEGTLLAKQ